jgi:hypothetical protein
MVLSSPRASMTRLTSQRVRGVSMRYCACGGIPTLGSVLEWSKWGGGNKLTYFSKGDLSRILEHIRSVHDLPLPLGLFIPFEQAWTAVEEFVETDGELPKGIAWISEKDLPSQAFPKP